MNRTQFQKIGVLCMVSALFNVIVCTFNGSILKAPLYMDTIFNVAMCFCSGLLPGLITGMLLSPIIYFLVCRYIIGLSVELNLLTNIWVICVFVEVLLVYVFHTRMKNREAVFLERPSLQSFIGVAAQLMVLVVLDCIVISLSGGIIDFVLTVLQTPRASFPEDSFKLGLFRNNVPLLPAAILSRIPINIVDRFIAIFGGYGVSLVFVKWVGGKKDQLENISK